MSDDLEQTVNGEIIIPTPKQVRDIHTSRTDLVLEPLNIGAGNVFTGYVPEEEVNYRNLLIPTASTPSTIGYAAAFVGALILSFYGSLLNYAEGKPLITTKDRGDDVATLGPIGTGGKPITDKEKPDRDLPKPTNHDAGATDDGGHSPDPIPNLDPNPNDDVGDLPNPNPNPDSNPNATVSKLQTSFTPEEIAQWTETRQGPGLDLSRNLKALYLEARLLDQVGPGRDLFGIADDRVGSSFFRLGYLDVGQVNDGLNMLLHLGVNVGSPAKKYSSLDGEVSLLLDNRFMLGLKAKSESTKTNYEPLEVKLLLQYLLQHGGNTTAVGLNIGKEKYNASDLSGNASSYGGNLTHKQHFDDLDLVVSLGGDLKTFDGDLQGDNFRRELGAEAYLLADIFGLQTKLGYGANEVKSRFNDPRVSSSGTSFSYGGFVGIVTQTKAGLLQVEYRSNDSHGNKEVLTVSLAHHF